MTIIEMLKQSAILTVLGMAVVFTFLWFMIICVNFVGKLVHKMGWDKDILTPETKTPVSAGTGTAPEVAAAISAAVTEYRKEN
jgi:oxaloacetate decarboxylase gamma subunit